MPSVLDQLIEKYKGQCVSIEGLLDDQLKDLAEIRSLHLHITIIQVTHDTQLHNQQPGSLRQNAGYLDLRQEDRVECQRSIRGEQGNVLRPVTG